MRTPRHLSGRRVVVAATLSLVTVLALGACTGEQGVDPSTADWPDAVTPSEADGEFIVVWTAIAEAADDPALSAEVDRLAEVGYDVEPWSPACQSGAAEPLTSLTGFAEPVAVGVAFASEEDAGIFDTRDEGSTVSMTTGTWTC